MPIDGGIAACQEMNKKIELIFTEYEKYAENIPN